MEILMQLQRLLDEKAKRFMQFEQDTVAMLHCELDAMEHYSTQRSQLANEIDAICAEIDELCAKHPQSDLLRQAVTARCDYCDLPEAWQPLYEQAQSINGTLVRIAAENEQAMGRAVALRDQFLVRIRENANTPRILRYLSSGASGPEKGVLLNNKKC